MDPSIYDRPDFREVYEKHLAQAGRPAPTEADYEEMKADRLRMIEAGNRKLQISLELNDGKYVSDGAGGSIPTNGRWVKDASGTWVLADSLN